MGNDVMVTEAFLPPKEEYEQYLEEIFNTRSLTNNGVFARRLERGLREFLCAQNLCLCANGTLALQLALRALDLNGKKIITTPFTYVATASALLWENCEPVFADIDPNTLCISPKEVENILRGTPDAAGIMAVHVYGNACAVDELAGLAERYNARLIYDGAHAFGSKLNGKSLLSYGDAATCSFHATKLFHTVEGGCVIARDAQAASRLNLLRSFGHVGDEHMCLGINAKLSELHAAMGLSILPHMEENLRRRAKLAAVYDKALDMGNNQHLRRPALEPGLEWNHAYYPLLFSTPDLTEKVISALNRKDIFPRRYFYPSLTEIPYLKGQSCPVAENASRCALCLPFHAQMENELALNIARVVMEAVS